VLIPGNHSALSKEELTVRDRPTGRLVSVSSLVRSHLLSGFSRVILTHVDFYNGTPQYLSKRKKYFLETIQSKSLEGRKTF
jgi:hypothetical protein